MKNRTHFPTKHQRKNPTARSALSPERAWSPVPIVPSQIPPAPPTSSPAVPMTPARPCLASPQRMGHGEAPLQANALVHQELPEEPGGAAWGAPRGARPRGRGGSRGTLHRQDRVEAGRSTGCSGPFLDSHGGRGPAGSEPKAQPPRLRRGTRSGTPPRGHMGKTEALS